MAAEKKNGPKEIETLRHSASHILAQAVKELFPEVKLGIGPAIENGFYYDFERINPFTPEDLKKIEEKMEEHIHKNEKFEKVDMSEAEAKKLFKGEPYKLELMQDLIGEGEKPTFYRHGDFIDLCRGPHIESTGKAKGVKLLRIAAAYWRGDSKNKQLQRIYGTAFESRDELKAYLHQLEEAEKRDHNKLGRKLGIFMTSDVVGQGLPLLMPKGAKIFQILQRWVEDEEEKRGYLFTKTPLMAKSALYKISGHWDHYKEGMFIIANANEEMALRPMTCPFQFQIYNSTKRSYRELPIRYAETSTLFRNEESGEMHGLIRVRHFTLADAHIICTPEQVEKEFQKVLELIIYIMDTLGLKDYSYRFSKWDPNDRKGKYVNNPAAWDSTQNILKKILDKLKLNYTEAEGEAAFYGPKLDIQMKNVYGKEDTMFTVQIDFAMPERFEMKYTDETGKEVMPMVIHRSSIGCYERTMAMLIEHYAGKFPMWLSPVQVKILPIAERHNSHCCKMMEQMRESGLRVEVDDKPLTIGKKVRNAQIEQVNYILVIGDNEVSNNTVNVRTRNNEVLGEKPVARFIEEMQDEIQSKRIK